MNVNMLFIYLFILKGRVKNVQTMCSVHQLGIVLKYNYMYNFHHESSKKL